MKKLLVVTVTAAMLLSLAACSQSAKPAAKPDHPAQTETADSKNAQAETAETENVQIPNPWTDYDSKDDAAQAAGFDLAVPDEISGCSEKSYRVLSAEGDVMFEIIYASGEDETARIRKAPGANDVFRQLQRVTRDRNGRRRRRARYDEGCGRPCEACRLDERRLQLRAERRIRSQPEQHGRARFEHSVKRNGRTETRAAI